MSTPEHTPAPRMAWSMYKRIALAALVIVLSTTAAVATAALLEVKDDIGGFQPLPGIGSALDDVAAGQPQTILLLGSDRRFSDIKAKIPARSDTMILMRLDPKSGATSIMNVPRDLKIHLAGYGTQKINAAYEVGGAPLSTKVVRSLLAKGSPDGHFPINHVININFGGFQRAINRLGCVYTDVDHHYFNDNSGPGPGYAAIDISAGYQRLCGGDALEYVRYRHLDNDLVRAARQQDFLRQAKDQFGVSKLLGDRKELLRIVGAYTQTDIQSTGAVLRLIKLAVESAKNPLRQVHFDADEDGDYLTISEANLKRDVGAFLGAASNAGRAKVSKTSADRARERSQKRKAKKQSAPAGVVKDVKTPENTGIQMGARLPFGVYYPGYVALGSNYGLSQSRAYDIVSRTGRKYPSYRYVVSAPGVGQYYGVQGTTWKDAPILKGSFDNQRMGGKDLRVYYDGDRIRMVAWTTPKAAYWISNTLLQSLTNKQMLAIAGSMRRVGS